MKKCINCGNQLNDNQKFCPVCGVKQPDTDRGPKDPGNKGGNKGKNNGDRTIMIIGIVALAVSVVVLASVLILIHFLKGKKSNSGDDDSQVVFTEEEYREALEAYSEYIEDYADEYNSGEFAADIMLDSIGNPVLVTYDCIEDDDNDTLNILWYDGKDIECIYEFSGSDEFEALYLCTDGIFYYPDIETETLAYYQISGGEVNKILTQSEDSEAVIYYEGKQYNLDFMDADTYCDENEELLENFYLSIYDEEIVNNALKNYSAFDLMSTGGVENLSNMGSILSPYYSYSDHYHDIFEKDQIENLISELKDNYINTQKEFYIYKENFIDGNIYVDDSQRKAFCGDVLYDNAIVMRDVNWFYEMNILDSYFENNPYMDYKDVFIESIRFPADAFGYESWNELICLCNQNDEDADNAAYIYEYMESYVGIIKIEDLIDKYGSDWKSIIEEYTEWVYSDEFADKVSDTGERHENGEDIFADFDEDLNDDDVVVQEEENDVTDEECTLPVPSSDGEKIYIYSWNEEMGAKVWYFKEKYPELANLVECVDLNMIGTSDDYKSTIKEHLELGSSDDQYASIFVVDESIAKEMLSSDYVMSVYDAGFTDDMFKNMYQYTLDMGTVDGELKGLTWQACPGCLCYRSDIAEKVLGVTSPDKMQAMVSDWDGFWEVAELMKDSGYYMLSGTDDLKYVCGQQNESPWVTGNALSVNEGARLYLEYAKMAYDNGYTKDTLMWTSDWTANMSSDVFCYFGCTWFVYWTLEYSMGADWNICEGPDAYVWGGSYLAIGKDTPNKELAAFVAYTLCCDTDVMKSMIDYDLEFVNNKYAVQLAIDDDIDNSSILDGQDPLEVWTRVASDVDLSTATEYDYTMSWVVEDAVSAYKYGDVSSYEEAIEYIKEEAASYFPELTVN